MYKPVLHIFPAGAQCDMATTVTAREYRAEQSSITCFRYKPFAKQYWHVTHVAGQNRPGTKLAIVVQETKIPSKQRWLTAMKIFQGHPRGTHKVAHA